MMAPHQKERTTGKLLLEAADKLERLEKLEEMYGLLRPYMTADAGTPQVKMAWDNLEAWWKRNAA